MSSREITIAQPRLVMEDPHNCTDMADALTVLEAVHDTLVRRDGQVFVPSLATGWDVADDGRLWTFTLREGVRFHDGTPFDAQAVVATLRRMARPDMGVTLGAPGVYAQYLRGARFAAVDDLTLRIELAEPMSDLLDLLVYGYVAAPGVLDDPVAQPCGTGPFIVESIGADRITARANPDHFAGPPAADRIAWTCVPDAQDRRAAFADGTADIANRLPPDQPPGADMHDYLAPTTLIYLFNAAEGPLADRRVRRALNLALDRRALVQDVMGGAGVPLHGPFSPLHRGHVPPAATGPDRDAALALLDAAGHGGGLTLKVDCPTSLPDEAEALTAAVAAQLAPLGVRFDVRLIEDREEYAHMVRRSEIRDMCVFEFIAALDLPRPAREGRQPHEGLLVARLRQPGARSADRPGRAHARRRRPRCHLPCVSRHSRRGSTLALLLLPHAADRPARATRLADARRCGARRADARGGRRVMADLIVTGGPVLTMDPARRVIHDGAVAIAGGRILAVGRADEIAAAHEAREVIDTAGKLVMPGLIDVHAHAGHGLIKNMGQDLDGAWEALCGAVYTRASPPNSGARRRSWPRWSGCGSAPPAVSRFWAAATRSCARTRRITRRPIAKACWRWASATWLPSVPPGRRTP